MDTIKNKIDNIVKSRWVAMGENASYSQAFFASVLKDVKSELPEHHALSLQLADTIILKTNVGARTTHYTSYDFDKVEFTENQATKIDNRFQGRIIFDPNIGRKPSKAEQIFGAAWVMACIDEEEGRFKNY